MSEATFRLSVRIATNLGEVGAQELRLALAESGSENSLTMRETRSGIIWKIDLGGADRPEHLVQRVIDLGDVVAHTISRITQEEKEVVFVSLRQEIDDVDDEQQKGIWFTQEAVRWAALAGATIDIDQYIYVD